MHPIDFVFQILIANQCANDDDDDVDFMNEEKKIENKLEIIIKSNQHKITMKLNKGEAKKKEKNRKKKHEHKVN